MGNFLREAVLSGALIVAFNGWLLGARADSGSAILKPTAGALLGEFYGTGTLAQTAANLWGQEFNRSP
jgi:hypothetical protein